jgi:putative FmdB family regulatory protein
VPLYEYACKKCGKHVDKIEKVDGPHLKKCPTCGGPVERMASAPAIQFKGSGWYVNDYGRSSSKDQGGKDAGANDSGGKETAAKGDKEGASREGARASNNSEGKSDRDSSGKKADAQGTSGEKKKSSPKGK